MSRVSQHRSDRRQPQQVPAIHLGEHQGLAGVDPPPGPGLFQNRFDGHSQGTPRDAHGRPVASPA